MPPEISPEELAQLAFREGPAYQANALIAEVRQQVLAAKGDAVSYEVPLTGRPLAYLQQTVAPRLAFFLKSKRLAVARCGHVFLSLFWEETLYFIWATDFFAAIQKSLGLDDASFRAVARRWEQTGQSAAGLLG